MTVILSKSIRSSKVETSTRGRMTYLEGAEEHARRTRGRGLTGEELERVIEEYPKEPQFQ